MFSPAKILLAALAVGSIVGCSESEPNTRLKVPGTYPTPQAAMDAAEPGDEILIAPGVYTETTTRAASAPGYPDSLSAVLFFKDDVVVTGGGSAGSVIFRGPSGDPGTVGIVFSGTNAFAGVQNVSVDGFATGMLLFESSAAVICSRTTNNTFGFHLLNSDGPILRGCLAENAEVALRSDSSTALIDFSILRNSTTGAEVVRGDPGFAVNVICGNGTGMHVRDRGQVFLQANSIRDNTGAGLLLRENAFVDLRILFPTTSRFLQQNDLFDNGVDLEVADYDPPRVDPIDATVHWWGGDKNLVEILDTCILDSVDDPARGATVEIQPFSAGRRFPIERFNDTIICTAPSNDVLEALREFAGLAGTQFNAGS